MTARHTRNGEVSNRTIRLLSAAVVVVALAVPITLGMRWWPDSLSTRHRTPATQLPAADLARYQAFAATPPIDRPLILSYHDIAPAGAADSSVYTVTPQQLDAHMAMIVAAGFTAITAEQLAGYLDGQPLPPRSVLITFDDGAKGVWRYADRILERYDLHATAFIITDSVGTNQPYYLTWNEMRQMRDRGRWDFGAHTAAGHVRLPLDADGSTLGPFLTNRAWLAESNRLETFEEWRARVADDLDRNVLAFVEHGFDPPLLFAHPFAAVTSPTNDPAIPIALDRMVEERFVASVANRPNARPVGPSQIAARHFERIAVRAETTADELFQRMVAASATLTDTRS